LQSLGDAWVKQGDSAVLRVPSVIVDKESNYLLNPAHRDFHRIKVDAAESFSFDLRLVIA
jgi:RES domain-containing protein